MSAPFLPGEVRWVSSVHNCEDFFQQQPVRAVVRRALLRFDHVVAISGAVRDVLVDDLALPAGDVSVIYYGIELPTMQMKLVDRMEPGRVVCAVARLAPQKGLDVLIDALNLLPSDVSCVVAGADDGAGADLKARVARRGLQDRVRFLGFRTDVLAVIADADVLCMPSRWEGFGLVLLEMASVARPIVASDIPPLNEVLIGGETAWLVPPDDAQALASALGEVLADRREAERRSTAHRSRVSALFTLDRMLRQLDAVYG
jgi:glycosyltransferase involved in cell wall biosynthesis